VFFFALGYERNSHLESFDSFFREDSFCISDFAMIIQQIFFLFCFFFYAQSSSMINVVFTVKNLSTNEHLKLNFLTMITSLFQHTSTDNLHLHVIGDSDSQQFVHQTLQSLDYHHQVNKSRCFFPITKIIFLID
jgi:hypothetical protein